MIVSSFRRIVCKTKFAGLRRSRLTYTGILLALACCTSPSNSGTCSVEITECTPADGGVDAAGGTSVVDANLDVVSIETRGDAPTEAAPECVTAAECKNPLRPICSGAGRCQPCGSDNSCTGLASGSKCALTGACVVCLSSATCDEATPICTSDNRCVACNAQGADATACKTRNAAIPICASTGAKAGQCVECATDAQCEASAKPICDPATQACRRCQKDMECLAKSTTAPGICMSHDDGRCATTQETVVVSGTNLQAAIDAAVSGNKALVVLKGNAEKGLYAGGPQGKLAIIGSGPMRPGVAGGFSPGIAVTSGALFLRNVTFTNSTPGISVKSASLQMQSCDVNGNTGGVQLDGANFTIEDTTISDNKIGAGPSAQQYGGVLVLTPGTPKTFRNVQVLNNKITGIVCTAAIDMTNVTATGNVGSDIAPACQL
jgi:hypothetical protein